MRFRNLDTTISLPLSLSTVLAGNDYTVTLSSEKLELYFQQDDYSLVFQVMKENIQHSARTCAQTSEIPIDMVPSEVHQKVHSCVENVPLLKKTVLINFALKETTLVITDSDIHPFLHLSLGKIGGRYETQKTGSFILHTNLESVRVLDKRVPASLYPFWLDSLSSEFLELHYESCIESDEFDSFLMLRLGQVHIIYIQEYIDAVSLYINNVKSYSGKTDTVEDRLMLVTPAKKASEASRIKLDLHLNAPCISVPVNAISIAKVVLDVDTLHVVSSFSQDKSQLDTSCIKLAWFADYTVRLTNLYLRYFEECSSSHYLMKVYDLDTTVTLLWSLSDTPVTGIDYKVTLSSKKLDLYFQQNDYEFFLKIMQENLRKSTSDIHPKSITVPSNEEILQSSSRKSVQALFSFGLVNCNIFNSDFTPFCHLVVEKCQVAILLTPLCEQELKMDLKLCGLSIIDQRQNNRSHFIRFFHICYSPDENVFEAMSISYTNSSSSIFIVGDKSNLYFQPNGKAALLTPFKDARCVLVTQDAG